MKFPRSKHKKNPWWLPRDQSAFRGCPAQCGGQQCVHEVHDVGLHRSAIGFEWGTGERTKSVIPDAIPESTYPQKYNELEEMVNALGAKMDIKDVERAWRESMK